MRKIYCNPSLSLDCDGLLIEAEKDLAEPRFARQQWFAVADIGKRQADYHMSICTQV